MLTWIERFVVLDPFIYIDLLIDFTFLFSFQCIGIFGLCRSLLELRFRR
jgi:hypothetical protein